ncbi:MAG TPA: HK97 family phage prohead protease [Bacillota bacterium]|nr:HK97 family phage prohead protease [Bacillota bacterium]
MEQEIRILPSEIELRETEDGKRSIYGYAVKWEQPSEELGYFFPFREKFAKGAFADSLRNDKQKALWNHNSDFVLGSTKSGTLSLSEDETGLRFNIVLPENTWGKDAYESIKRGDVDGVSFGFKKEVDEWDESDPDNIIRTIKKAKLFEVSPTPFPAYPQTEVQARSVEEPYKEYLESKKASFGSDWKADNLRMKMNHYTKKHKLSN